MEQIAAFAKHAGIMQKHLKQKNTNATQKTMLLSQKILDRGEMKNIAGNKTSRII